MKTDRQSDDNDNNCLKQAFSHALSAAAAVAVTLPMNEQRRSPVSRVIARGAQSDHSMSLCGISLYIRINIYNEQFSVKTHKIFV